MTHTSAQLAFLEGRCAMNFEWVVALRFLREGRFQTALIIGGAAGMSGEGEMEAAVNILVEKAITALKQMPKGG